LNGSIDCALLAFSPLLEESDYSAESHKHFLEYHLGVYGKSLDNVICLVGDNMNTNKRLAGICDKPLVGCAAHRFNLECQRYLERQPYKSILAKINTLMTKLRTLKNSAMLREHTSVRPKIQCVTRWTGSFKMIKRYFQLKDSVLRIVESAEGVDDFMPTASEEKHLKILQLESEKLWSVMEALQSPSLSLHQVRSLFDSVMELFPSMNQYISPNSDIVHSPSFESGIVKLLRHDINFTQLEEDALKIMRRSDLKDQREVGKQELSFAAQVLAQSWNESATSLYMDPKVIPIGSVRVESLFSVSKHMFGYRRLGTHPTKIEEQLFLKTNRKFWDIDLVASVVSQHGRDGSAKEEEEKEEVIV